MTPHFFSQLPFRETKFEAKGQGHWEGFEKASNILKGKFDWKYSTRINTSHYMVERWMWWREGGGDGDPGGDGGGNSGGGNDWP